MRIVGLCGFFPLWLKTKERKSGGFYNDFNIGGLYLAGLHGSPLQAEFEEQRCRPLQTGSIN